MANEVNIIFFQVGMDKIKYDKENNIALQDPREDPS
jgi:hypothetical protein